MVLLQNRELSISAKNHIVPGLDAHQLFNLGQFTWQQPVSTSRPEPGRHLQ